MSNMYTSERAKTLLTSLDSKPSSSLVVVWTILQWGKINVWQLVLLNQKFDSSIPVAEGKILRYPINYKFLMLVRKENKHRLQALQIDNAWYKKLTGINSAFRICYTTYIFINRNINLGSEKMFLYSFLPEVSTTGGKEFVIY